MLVSSLACFQTHSKLSNMIFVIIWLFHFFLSFSSPLDAPNSCYDDFVYFLSSLSVSLLAVVAADRPYLTVLFSFSYNLSILNTAKIFVVRSELSDQSVSPSIHSLIHLSIHQLHDNVQVNSLGEELSGEFEELVNKERIAILLSYLSKLFVFLS